MKYWLFNDNQVEGPYDRETLLDIESFSPESLVCPEGRRGTSMGDWQRAGIIAELAETLLKKARIPAGAVPGGELGGSLLPPEPTLRDLAVLGTLQEKVNLLENALNQFQEDLRTRDEEISALKTDLDLKKQESENLETKVGEMESQLKEAQSLKEQIEETKILSSEQARTIDDLKSQIDSVRGDIDRVRETASRAPEPSSAPDLPAAGLDGPPLPDAPPGMEPLGEPLPDAPPILEPLPDLPGEALPDALPALEAPIGDGPAPFEPLPMHEGAPPALEPFGEPVPIDGEQTPPGLISPFENAPAFDESPFGAAPLEGPPALSEEIPNTFFGGKPSPAPLTPEPFPNPMATPMPGAPAPGGDMMVGMNAITGGFTGAGAVPEASADMAAVADAAASSDGLVDLTSASFPAPAKAPKKKSKLVAILLVVVIAAVGAAAAVYMGFIDISSLTGAKKEPASQPVMKSSAAPPADPKGAETDPAAVDPQAGMPDQSQEAIELAKNYRAGRSGKTLSAVLEGDLPQTGIEPWTVDPLGDDRYKVNFYESSGGIRSRVAAYQFEARLKSRTLSALNAKSQALLDGKLPSKRAAAPASDRPVQPRPSRVRKPRPRRSSRTGSEDVSGLLSDPLGSMLLDEPSSGRRSKRKEPPAAEESAEPEETVLPSEDEEEAAAAPPESGARKRRRRSRSDPKTKEDDNYLESILSSSDEAQEEEPAPKTESSKRNSRRHQASSKSREELTLDELLLPGVPKP